MESTDRGAKGDLQFFGDLSKGLLLVDAKGKDLLLLGGKASNSHLQL